MFWGSGVAVDTIVATMRPRAGHTLPYPTVVDAEEFLVDRLDAEDDLLVADVYLNFFYNDAFSIRSRTVRIALTGSDGDPIFTDDYILRLKIEGDL